MFTHRNKTPSDLDIAIDGAYSRLADLDETTEAYAQVLDQLVKLNKMKNENSTSVSKDTLAIIGANLTGIVMILKHEQVHVIATKAMSLVLKPK